jgi:hypothetical protein
MLSLPTSGRDLGAFFLLLVLPALLLLDSVFLGRHYLPFDLAEYPPAADTLTKEQRADLRIDANYDATEAPIWFAIELQLAREAISHGDLPQWNNYVRGGAPMLAHGHMGLLNPLHWPALLFSDPADGLLCLTYTMFALAGILMFGLLRTLQLGISAALFGAVTFAWSGTLTANGHWFMRMEPLALLPGALWALLAIARSAGRARALPTIGLAIAIAGIWLSGFPQYGIPVTILIALTAAVLCVRSFRSDRHLAGWMLLGGGLGIMLAMVQLAPMLQFYPLSNRPIDETLDRSTRHAFAPMGLLGYVFPELYSHPGDPSLPTEAAPLPWLWSDLHHWQTGEQLLPNYNFTEYAIFPGTLPLLFALLALVLRGPRWRWLAALGLGGIWLCATGAFGAWIAFLLPGIKTVPPYRFAGPACALVALLAAVGFDALQRNLKPWLLRTTAAALAVMGALCLLLTIGDQPTTTQPDDPWLQRIVERYKTAYAQEFSVPLEAVTPAVALRIKFTLPEQSNGTLPTDVIQTGKLRLRNSLKRTAAAWLFAALLFGAASLQRGGTGLKGWPSLLALLATSVELFWLGSALNHGQKQPFPQDSAMHQFLRAESTARRKAGGFLVGRGAGDYGPWFLPGGTLAMDQIRDLNFYTFVDSRSDQPIRKLYGDAQILRGFVCNALPDDERLTLPWWDLMGLRFVLASKAMQHAGRRVEIAGLPDNEYVYERPNVMPRAWVVPLLQIVPDAPANDPTLPGRRVTEGELDAVLDRAFAPSERAVLTKSNAALLPELPANKAAKARPVQFVQQDSKRLTLNIGKGPAGYLVVADTHMPGWTVAIDNKPVPLARGNIYQRVIALPEGECTVAFRFRTEGLVEGLILSLAAAAGCIGLLIVFVLSRSKPVDQNQRLTEPQKAT